MTQNVGMADRLLRMVVGIALVMLAMIGSIGVWGYIGLVPLATGALGTCPLYSMLGIKTCRAPGTKNPS